MEITLTWLQEKLPDKTGEYLQINPERLRLKSIKYVLKKYVRTNLYGRQISFYLVLLSRVIARLLQNTNQH